MMSSKVAQTNFDKDFNSAFRTRSHLILASSEDEMLYAFNPSTLELKLQWEGKSTPWGTNDDFILNDKNQIVDLQKPDLEW